MIKNKTSKFYIQNILCSRIYNSIIIFLFCCCFVNFSSFSALACLKNESITADDAINNSDSIVIGRVLYYKKVVLGKVVGPNAKLRPTILLYISVDKNVMGDTLYQPVIYYESNLGWVHDKEYAKNIVGKTKIMALQRLNSTQKTQLYIDTLNKKNYKFFQFSWCDIPFVHDVDSPEYNKVVGASHYAAGSIITTIKQWFYRPNAPSH